MARGHGAAEGLGGGWAPSEGVLEAVAVEADEEVFEVLEPHAAVVDHQYVGGRDPGGGVGVG